MNTALQHSSLRSLVGIVTMLGCGVPTTFVDVGLPDRSGPPDLTRVTNTFRMQGGNAFIGLTGLPTPSAVEALADAGLVPALGYSRIVTFDSLAIPFAWGRIVPDGVDAIARLSFVISIEPSEEPIGPSDFAK